MASDISNIIKKIDNLINKYDSVEKKIDWFFRDYESGKLYRDIMKPFNKNVKKDEELIFHTSVDDFYESYKPDFYKRKESLYNMYKVWETEDDVFYGVGPDPEIRDVYSQTFVHRVERFAQTDYIYEKVWVEGWHGGATYSSKLDYFHRPYPAGYEMAYRKPPTNISRGIKKGIGKKKKGAGQPRKPIPAYSLWSYRMVEKSTSPDQLSKLHLDRYKNGNYDNYSGSTLRERLVDVLKPEIDKYGLFDTTKIEK